MFSSSYGIAVMGVTFIDIMLSMVRAEYDDPLRYPIRKVSGRYLSFYFWTDLLGLIDLKYYYVPLCVFQLTKTRQIMRATFTMSVGAKKIIEMQPYRANYGFPRLISRSFTLFTNMFLTLHFFSLVVILVGYSSLETEFKDSEETLPQVYLLAWYFVATTMTTVGYGDIIGQDNISYLVCIVLGLNGIMVYGYLLRGITNVVDNAQSIAWLHVTELDEFEEWTILRERMSSRIYSDKLLKRIKESFKRQQRMSMATVLKSNFVWKTPQYLRSNLLKVIVTNFHNRFSSFFTLFHHSLTEQIMLHCEYKM